MKYLEEIGFSDVSPPFSDRDILTRFDFPNLNSYTFRLGMKYSLYCSVCKLMDTKKRF